MIRKIKAALKGKKFSSAFSRIHGNKSVNDFAGKNFFEFRQTLENETDGLILPVDPDTYLPVIRDFFVSAEIRPYEQPEDYTACCRTAFGAIIIARSCDLSRPCLLDFSSGVCVSLPFHFSYFFKNENFKRYIDDSMFQKIKHLTGKLGTDQIFDLHQSVLTGTYKEFSGVKRTDFSHYVERELARMKQEKNARREMSGKIQNVLSRYPHGGPSRGYLTEDCSYSGIALDSAAFVTFYREGQLCDATLKGCAFWHGTELEPGSRVRFAENGKLVQARLRGGLLVAFDEHGKLNFWQGLCYVRKRKTETILETDYLSLRGGFLTSNNPLDIENEFYRDAPGIYKKRISESDGKYLSNNLFSIRCCASISHRVYPVIGNDRFTVTLDTEGRSIGVPKELLIGAGENCIDVPIQKVKFQYQFLKTTFRKQNWQCDSDSNQYLQWDSDRKIVKCKIDSQDDLLLPEVCDRSIKNFLNVKSHAKNKSLKKSEYPVIAEYVRKKYVPVKGQAETVQGELFRVLNEMNVFLCEETSHGAEFVLSLNYIKQVLSESGVFDVKIQKKILQLIEDASERKNIRIKDAQIDWLQERMVDWFIVNQTPVLYKNNSRIFI